MKEAIPPVDSDGEESLESILNSIQSEGDADMRLAYIKNRIELYTRYKKDAENALVYASREYEPKWREEIQGLALDIEEYERWHDAIIDMMEEKGWIPQTPKKE